MSTPFSFSILGPTVVTLLTAVSLFAQAPGVKIVRDRGHQFDALVDKANKLRVAGQLLSLEQVNEQLWRTSCNVKLPKASTKKLTEREIWRQSQAAHVRVGWHYLCKKCSKWHQNLAGGYFITADDLVATCHHVVKPNEGYREGFLVAGTEEGELFPVTEVLASNADADTAIIRAKVPFAVKPLPLNANVYPGDSAWCYSDPLGRPSYFSKGMVNRFYVRGKKGDESSRMEVSTDWAPGSSGAAVVDQCGNAIGHVSEISSASSLRARGTNQPAGSSSSPMIVFHSAARAADVISLVKPAGGK